MTLSANPTVFVCVRCGEPYDPGTFPAPSRHLHPEDRGYPPPLCHRRELARRQDLLAGLYQPPCPVCRAGPASWCTAHGELLLDMHPERRSA